MNCESCGAALTEGARFCAACGAPVAHPKLDVDTISSAALRVKSDPRSLSPEEVSRNREEVKRILGELGTEVRRAKEDADAADRSKSQPRSPRKCAVGPCHDLRIEGSDYCAVHGPVPPLPKWTPSPPVQSAVQTVEQTEVAEPPKPTGVKAIECPYCHKVGGVTTRPARRVKGVSGVKTTYGILTGGMSLMLTGISRAEWVTRARCKNCTATWDMP